MTTNNKIIKFISALLIISIITPAILFSKPKQAEALSETIGGALGIKLGGAFGSGVSLDPLCALGPGISSSPTKVPVSDSVAQGYLCTIATVDTVDTSLHSWENVFEYVTKEIIKVAVRRLLAQLTQAIINWINIDFHGAPLFLENPGSFFRDIAKSEVKNMVNMIGYDTLRYPFGRQTALNIIDSYKRQLATNAQYTLSKVVNDPDFLRRYQNDFDFGGWNGFLINTQYPQNNYLGFKMMIEQNLASRVEGTMVAPAQEIKEALNQGMGFLSPQRCPSNDKYNNGFNEFSRPSFQHPPFVEPPCPNCTESEQQDAENEAWKTYNKDRDAKRAEWVTANTCPGGLENTTPGSVAANQVMMALGSPLRLLELDAALGNSLAAIIDALINNLFEKGLNALADFVNPPPSFEDNWSYYGNTLDYDNNTNQSLGLPTSVSIRVGDNTSIRIPARYYIIQSQSDESVATAKIDVSGSSGNKLMVTGFKSGTNIVTIQDSLDPTQTFLFTITVVGDLIVSPASISFGGANSQVSANISGGTGRYFIEQDPDKTIAIANITDTTLIVTMIGNGDTFVKIKDSSAPTKSVQVDIKVKSFVVTPSKISIYTNQTVNLPISNGKIPYFVTDLGDIEVATAEILTASPTMLTITGKGVGTSLVKLQDSSNNIKTAKVKITVVNTGNLVVSPANILIDVNQTFNAAIFGGTGDYVVQPQSDESKAVATAEILFDNPTILRITGFAPGKTIVTVQDSFNPTMVADITIETLPFR